jgi:mannobiose 2-epimerase
VYLAVFHNQPEKLNDAYQSWKYIKDNIVDNEGGEWHWSRKNGVVNTADDKAGFWKCPYHNSRMCLEVFERLSQLTSF